jgi:hypothetical protein
LKEIFEKQQSSMSSLDAKQAEWWKVLELW